MSLVKFKSQNHPQQPTKDSVDDRGTDPTFFAELSERFGGFSVDVAASAHNTKTERYYDREANGLEVPWSGERVWCNPPYSDIRPWVEAAWREWDSKYPPELIVMLLPANRTEQGWWQDLVEPQLRHNQVCESCGWPRDDFRVEFIRGRLRFVRADKTEIGPNERPPFGSCLLIWSHQFGSIARRIQTEWSRRDVAILGGDPSL